MTYDSDEFTVGLVQMSCAAAAGENLRAALAGIRDAAAHGAQVVCLQELFSSPYFCQVQDAAWCDLAEPIPGPTTEAVAKVAAELEVVVVVPLFERRAPGLYHNSAAVIDADGSLLGTYRKMHIPDDPQFLEKFYFTPGDLGYRSFRTRYANVGVLICWDQWFPEAARLTALQGAEILFYPTAIGWIPGDRGTAAAARQQCAWRTVQCGHAIGNGVYVAAPNRVGTEEGGLSDIQFWGRSFVCDPQGEVIAEASGADPEVLTATCSRALLEGLRRAWPFWRDRRIDSYGPIAGHFAAGAER
jgi:N-carbamoylputrescine amidase